MTRLTDEDRRLIWLLLAERDRLRRELYELRNARIGARFGACAATISHENAKRKAADELGAQEQVAPAERVRAVSGEQGAHSKPHRVHGMEPRQLLGEPGFSGERGGSAGYLRGGCKVGGA